MDDDCDGEVDEDLTRACSTICGPGSETCVDGAWVGCDAPTPTDEECNGRDDDCDGPVDEELSRDCSTACGAGTETCSAGAWMGCEAPPPVPEECNDVDDDCNGLVDDELTRACTTPCGTGVETCSAGAWGACSAGGGAEECNGLDDDCDGVRDEEGCPCPIFEHGGHLYQLCTTTRSWTDALAACRASPGYDLVSLDDAAEETAVWGAAIAAADEDWWIGLNDRADEGTFAWPNGSTSTHRHWAGGQPNDYFGQDCVTVDDGTGAGEERGHWNDRDCGDSHRYICEAP